MLNGETLTSIDPSRLANGFYTIRLTATDIEDRFLHQRYFLRDQVGKFDIAAIRH